VEAELSRKHPLCRVFMASDIARPGRCVLGRSRRPLLGVAPAKRVRG
jgi:hypothetical protein